MPVHEFQFTPPVLFDPRVDWNLQIMTPSSSPINPEEVPRSSSPATLREGYEEISAIYYSPESFNSMVQNESLKIGKRKKKAKVKKRVVFDDVAELSSSASSCSSSVRLQRRGIACGRWNPKFQIGSARRSGGAFDALALSLGMSFAAFVTQVMERQEVAGERIPIDHLSVICASAIRESLVNVFGNKLDCFLRNFETSFDSTLRTLRSLSDSSKIKDEDCFIPSGESSKIKDEDCFIPSGESSTSNEAGRLSRVLATSEELKESDLIDSMNRELVIRGQTNENFSLNPILYGSEPNHYMCGTLEKSVMEQTRSNDLKTLELGLTMRMLKMKETQLTLNFDANDLERSKLAMGISKASFKAEKFKTQIEDTRHGELLRKCIDCLVTGLFIMSASLSYGAYVYSYRRISEATASCTPSSKETKSWWFTSPMAAFNSGLHVLMCKVQVVSRMLFGVLLIVAISYLLLQRSASSKQTMPITLILLLLGVACGFAGKFCVDTLGGSGFLWLLYWETLCLLHFLSNVFTSMLFVILYGPVAVSRATKFDTLFPYWIRRILFYAILLIFLPLLCGLVPFASVREWKDHFLMAVTDFFESADD